MMKIYFTRIKKIYQSRINQILFLRKLKLPVIYLTEGFSPLNNQIRIDSILFKKKFAEINQ